jgi:hypothetical protein
MNAIDPNFGREAVVRYGDSELQVIRPGDYVLCAVTRRRVPLNQLKYWSVSRQEAYAGPEQAMERFKATGAP